MSMLKTWLKKNPIIVYWYRLVRDEIDLMRIKSQYTPFGFSLATRSIMGNQGDLMAKGMFEPEETTAILKYADRFDVFVDVGANIGYFSCLLQSRGKHVIAIEPIKRNLDYLYYNLMVNHFNNVEVWPVAVGSSNGILPLYGDATGASFIKGWGGGRQWQYLQACLCCETG